ncbi:hypothetical protein VE03_08076 [Pseudogymnoascus sp. 23342-1-I1]|nr:hypothetical protein VE03_08076 [Pseudogymnoascus sp. 23342-1-I1]
MSTYDSYETEAPRRHRSHRHHHHRDERDDPRYETTDTYVRGPAIVDPPYVSSRQDLTLRGREDSDLSVEEVPRAFPPPGGDRMVVRDDRYGPPARSRSVDRHSQYGQYLGETRRSERDNDSRLSVDKEKKGVRRRRSLSRNQKIMAAVGGAALAVGGKELWDYRQSKSQGGERKDRNILATAAVGAAGAFAGFEGADIYTKKFGDKKEKEVKEVKEKHAVAYDRDGHAIEYYSEEEVKEEKPKKSRRKSIVEGAMSLAGLGAAAKAMGGHDDDRSDRGDRRDRGDRDDRRRRHSSESSRGSRRTRGDDDRSRGKSPEGVAKFQQAAKAALLAGAAEAFRVRNEPGGWGGAKGKRILTAAIGAGGVGAAAAGDNPDHNSKRHLLEAVVGGLAGNRLINGARSDDGKSSHGGSGRRRSRSRSAMPIAALATAGLGALAAKKHHDRSRSRSRDDRRRRSGSEDSLESRDRRPKRSKSVTDYARKGLAALGLNDAADDKHGSSRRDRDRDVDDSRSDARSHKSSRRHRDDRDRDRDLDSSDDDYDRNRRDDRHRDRDYDDRRSQRGSEGRNRRVAEGKQAISDSDSLGSSTDDNKRIKKMKGKQFLTAGLATVATIHAAHNVYQSVERRKAGHKAVAEGDMTPEEARKEKAKARFRTAASVGIAGLGIKGAISEWKEMSEMREEYRKAQVERTERHQRRCDRAATRSNQGRSRRVSPNRRIANAPYQSSSDLSPSEGRNGRQPLYIDDDPYAPYAEKLPPPPGFDSRDSRDSRRR